MNAGMSCWYMWIYWGFFNPGGKPKSNLYEHANHYGDILNKSELLVSRTNYLNYGTISVREIDFKCKCKMEAEILILKYFETITTD